MLAQKKRKIIKNPRHLQRSLLLIIRGVHGSGQLGFVPNPDPTRIIRVEENMARNRPGDMVGFFDSGLVGFKLYGFGYRVSSPGSIFGWIQRDLAGSVKIQPRFHRIMARSHWIQLEIRYTSLERIKVRFKLGVTGFETKNQQPTHVGLGH